MCVERTLGVGRLVVATEGFGQRPNRHRLATCCQ